METEEKETSGPQGQGAEEATGEDGEKGDAVAEAGADQSEQSGMNLGFDPVNNSFNMNFGNGDMTQMQMMMAMQNGMTPGMTPAAFSSFPMMGSSLLFVVDHVSYGLTRSTNRCVQE